MESGGSLLVRTSNKIVNDGAKLQAWGSMKTNPQVAEIKRLQKLLERLNSNDQMEATRSEFVAASKQLDDLLLK